MEDAENLNSVNVAPKSPTKAHSLPEHLADRIREELTCVICYDLSVRPATLPCGHTACRRCLNRALAAGRVAAEKRCPSCRQPLPVGMPPLALNTTLKALAELLLPDDCAERDSGRATPEDEPRPRVFTQRVNINTGTRAVSLHTTHEITGQAQRSAVAGLNALLGVMEERWPEAVFQLRQDNAAAAPAPAPAASPAPAPEAAPAAAPRSQPHTAGRPPLEQPRWRSTAARDVPLPQDARSPAAAARQLDPVFISARAMLGAASGASPPPRRQPRWGAGPSFRDVTLGRDQAPAATPDHGTAAAAAAAPAVPDTEAPAVPDAGAQEPAAPAEQASEGQVPAEPQEPAAEAAPPAEAGGAPEASPAEGEPAPAAGQEGAADSREEGAREGEEEAAPDGATAPGHMTFTEGSGGPARRSRRRTRGGGGASSQRLPQTPGPAASPGPAHAGGRTTPIDRTGRLVWL